MLSHNPKLLLVPLLFALNKHYKTAVVLLAALLWFHRAPRLSLVVHRGCIYSPAAGRVVRVDRNRERTVVVIHLSLFDIHCQYTPISGRITEQHYKAGTHYIAYDDVYANSCNEQMITLFESDLGERVIVRQLAGKVARRIFSLRSVGETVHCAEPYGFISFGSRVDIIVPSGTFVPVVAVGEHIQPGKLLGCS